MSDQNQQCPSGWSRIEDPVRACAGKSAGCHCFFLYYLVHVCGRIMAYQKGAQEAFQFRDHSANLGSSLHE